MKDIKKCIENLQVSISKVEDKEYKEIFNNIEDILGKLSYKVEEVMTNQTVLAENLKYIDDDIVNLQEELFEEVSVEELSELEEEYKEVYCKHCGKPVYMESTTIEEASEIPCPYCGENII